MSSAIKEFFSPTSLKEALKILAKYGQNATVLAGGTFQGQKLPPRISTLVDILRCGLEGIDIRERQVFIGATTPVAAVAADPGLDVFGTGILREAAAAISGQPVRNQVTVAGNLLGPQAWSDLPVALVALDAVVRLARHGHKDRLLNIAQLYLANPRQMLLPGEIVTRVEIKLPKAGVGGAFIKFARTEADLALVSAGAVVRIENNLCVDARIVLGSAKPRPTRALTAEEYVRGKTLDDATIEQAAILATDDLSLSSDFRTSKEYRQRLLKIAVQRALALALRRAKGEVAYVAPRRPTPPMWTRQPLHSPTGSILSLVIDGVKREIQIEPSENLLDVLRRVGAVSVKRGCNEGYCGTCAILVDGRLLNACLLLAAQVDGCTITTAAGIGSVQSPHPIQTALVEEGAVQCGFCTPGMVVASKSLLDQIPDPKHNELCAAMDGNLCRCTGYVKPLLAITKAAQVIRQGRPS